MTQEEKKLLKNIYECVFFKFQKFSVMPSRAHFKLVRSSRIAVSLSFVKIES